MNILSFLFGGFVSSFLISLYFYHKCYKRDLDELTKNFDQQFVEQRDFLNKFHDINKKTLLTMYKNRLVNQLKNDMAIIWNVRPGATNYDIHDMEGFNRDSEELLNQEIELEAKPIDISGLELTAQDIIRIEPFIEVIEDD